MFLKFLLIVMLVLSVGCVHTGNGDVQAKAGVPVVEPATEVLNDAQVKEVSQLDAALLYSLLSGEIAGQRGNVDMATAFYVDAAKRSGDPMIALRAAQIALYNKDIVAAKSAVDVLVQEGDLSVKAHRLALTIYLRSADVEKSLSQMRLLLEKSDIPRKNTFLAIGDMVSRNANKVVAIAVMDALVKDNSKAPGLYLARSQVMSNMGLLSRADPDARQAISLDPSWPVPYVQLALVLESKGDAAGALAVLKASSEQLGVRQLLMGYGQLLAKNGQYEAAKKQFVTLVSNEKDYPEAKFALGLVYLKLDDAVSAREVFEGLNKEGAFASKSAFYLGRISYYEKELDEALVWFLTVGKGANYIDSQASIAMIKSAQGDLKGARAVLQKLRNEYPKNKVRFYLLEAELLMDGQHNAQLYALLMEAVSENPTDLALRYTRSIAATEVDDIAMAEEDLLYVLDKEPKHIDALNALGYTLASKTFRFKEARQYLTQALSLRPNDAAILDSMGWLNYREGQYEKALVLLRKAYAKSPAGEIAAHLGEALWMLGRQKEAKRVWEKALEQDAGNRYLIEVLQRLR